MGLARIVKGKRTTKTGGASITVSINEPPTRDPGILERYVERYVAVAKESPAEEQKEEFLRLLWFCRAIPGR